MIITLYDSDYPGVQDGTPNWKELPVGYFITKKNDVLKGEEIALLTRISGRFSYCIGIKPRGGEHLLAVFAVDGITYLCNSTISYENELEATKDDEWDAVLAFSSIIHKW
jgi:hypothetical protein